MTTKNARTDQSMSFDHQDIADARMAATDAKRLSRSAKSGRTAVMSPRPMDWGEGLAMVNAIDYLAYCVVWMANELEKDTQCPPTRPAPATSS